MLARLYEQSGALDSAAAAYHKALGLIAPEDSLGNADLLHGLAHVRAAAGDRKEALELYRRSAAIRERRLGREHPLLARALVDEAHCLTLERRRKKPSTRRCGPRPSPREHVRLTASLLPERQALQYAAARTRGLDLALELAARGLDDGANARVLDALVRGRAQILDEMASRHRDVVEFNRLAERREAASQRLSQLVIHGPAELPPDEYDRLVREAREDMEEAERKVAERSTRFRESRAHGQIGLEDVAHALPEGSALVAYARYASGDAHSAVPHAASYIAFVLRAGASAPEVVPLGRAEHVDSLVARWRALASRAPDVLEPEAEERACRVAGDALRTQVWDPVATHLGGTERAFVTLDGALHGVPLAALPVAPTVTSSSRGRSSTCCRPSVICAGRRASIRARACSW